MILVTGAAGKTGRAVIRALAEHGQRPVAFVRSQAQATAMAAAGAQRVIAGDFEDAADIRRAMEGVQAVYHICPNMHPHEVAIGRTVIGAAASAGVERFVYHSVLHPQTEKMPHHWQKLRVEELLFESGLAFTILQPAVYMQNILAATEAILNQGRYPVPYAAASRLSFVDLADVAAVAARVLVEDGHAGAIYELAGTPPLSQTEVAAILSESAGRPVTVKVVDREAWRRGAVAAGLSGYAIATLLAMFRYYEAFGLSGNPRLLGWLLGREPVSLRDFARDHLQG
ncbi:MAG: NmrA family NAD(P)-binding protein [Caldilineales bacterium]|nr:NmrA family NAD(P)-binding protein [Caldilineales bacterium]MCW5859740.1 NmrA family NAD(P)-binding protein [Caldilineales bacterium]